MQEDLIAGLVGKPQRETAGSDTSSRFDYQKNWAFCQMLKRHMAGADYLVAFEFHDDVVFLEPNASPTKAEFYQVKTSKGAKSRTLGALLSRKSGSNSILGKMCLNFDGICSHHETRVLLVSNVAFNFSDEDICADDLDPKYRNQIVEKLTAEIPSLDLNRLAKMHFLVTDVSLAAMQSFLKGEVAELFKAEFGEEHGLNIHSWIRLIQTEINRKNNFPSSDIKNSNDLIDKKCISRTFLSDSITCVSRERTTPPNMHIIYDELKSSGWDATSLMRLDKQIPNATFDYSNAANSDVARIVEIIEMMLSARDSVVLSDFLDEISQNISEISNGAPLYSNPAYLWALAILVYHEKI